MAFDHQHHGSVSAGDANREHWLKFYLPASTNGTITASVDFCSQWYHTLMGWGYLYGSQHTGGRWVANTSSSIASDHSWMNCDDLQFSASNLSQGWYFIKLTLDSGTSGAYEASIGTTDSALKDFVPFDVDTYGDEVGTSTKQVRIQQSLGMGADTLDWYFMQLSAGEVVTADAFMPDGESLEPRIRVYIDQPVWNIFRKSAQDATGRWWFHGPMLQDDTDGLLGHDSHVQFVAHIAGTYLFEIEPLNATSGYYRVDIHRAHSNATHADIPDVL